MDKNPTVNSASSDVQKLSSSTSHKAKVLTKRQASPMLERPGKIIKGSPKSFGLSQVTDPENDGSFIIRNESPWDTFRRLFICELAGSVIVAVHRSRPSRTIAIRTYPEKDTNRMLQRYRQIQHENIISATECYREKGFMFALVEDLPLTLEHLVGCHAIYPDENQLASIISQILNGLSHLLTMGLEHESLLCSNILLGLDGIVKIAGLEFCVERSPNQSQAQLIKALATIAMELMQKYEKDDGLIGIDDLDRWPVDSDAVGFLSATSSALSIEELKHHPLVTKPYQSQRGLIGLARFALISAKTFYSL